MHEPSSPSPILRLVWWRCGFMRPSGDGKSACVEATVTYGTSSFHPFKLPVVTVSLHHACFPSTPRPSTATAYG